MRPTTPPTIAVVLVNLGTPDAPTVPAVRSYLKQFLSDTRVIEIPKLLWAIILNLFVLPNRPKRVAAAYASIWQDGDSPMRLILNEQSVLFACFQRLKQTKQPQTLATVITSNSDEFIVGQHLPLTQLSQLGQQDWQLVNQVNQFIELTRNTFTGACNSDTTSSYDSSCICFYNSSDSSHSILLRIKTHNCMRPIYL